MSSDAQDSPLEERLFRRNRRSFFKSFHYFFSKYALQFLFALFIITTFSFVIKTPVAERFELVVLDYLFRQRTPPPAHPDIVLLNVAEDSIEALGRWPWDRKKMGLMTHILTEWGAEAIIFDIYFAEENNPESDQFFADKIKENGRVYLPKLIQNQKRGRESVETWLHSLPLIEEYAAGFGHINIIPDRDGTLRNALPIVKLDEGAYKHIAIEVAEDYLERSGEKIDFVEELPQDHNGAVLLNWAGPWETTFTHYSFWDVVRSYAAIQKGWNPLVDPAQFKGKIMIIGVTAPGMPDIKATPLQKAYPGVGVIANFLNSMLVHEYVKKAPMTWNMIVLLLMGALGLVTFMFVGGLRAFLLGMLYVLAIIFFTIVMFSNFGIWFYSVSAVLQTIVLMLFCSIFSLIAAQVEKNRLFELATRDGLTGLYVIRHFRALLNAAADEARRKAQKLSVVLIDIDHFKPINDTHGHDAGDFILKELAQLLEMAVNEKQSSRHKSTVARYGGEEFVMMFQNCAAEETAFRYAEHVRKRIADHRFVYEGTHIPVTISLGVSEYKLSENVPDLTVRRADTGLYRAKDTGRNQVCIELESTDKSDK